MYIEPSLIIILLLVIILLILGVLIALLVLLLKAKRGVEINGLGQTTGLTPPKKKVEIKSLHNCHNHPELNSIGLCNICEQAFCEKCLQNFENLNFCREHTRLFAENKWVDIATVQTSPEKPEEAIHLYELKSSIWEKEQIPSYVITHYKINMENDFIESYVKLFVTQKDEKSVSIRLPKKQQTD